VAIHLEQQCKPEHKKKTNKETSIDYLRQTELVKMLPGAILSEKSRGEDNRTLEKRKTWRPGSEVSLQNGTPEREWGRTKTPRNGDYYDKKTVKEEVPEEKIRIIRETSLWATKTSNAKKEFSSTSRGGAGELKIKTINQV